MSFAIGTSMVTLASAVTNTNTFTVPYPSGLAQADLLGSTGGQLALNDNDVFPQAASGAGTVAFTFGASNITVTNNSGITFPANSTIRASFGRSNQSGRYAPGVSTTPPPQTLTAATGTASLTIADVGGSFAQATLNNNFRSLAEQVNLITAALRKAGLTPG